MHVFVGDRSATSNDVLVQFEHQYQVFVARFHSQPARILVYFHRYNAQDTGPLEEPAAVIDGTAAKAQYSEELRRLKKGCNRIALAAKLLTPWLRHVMMLYMKVTDAHWLAFGILASFKLNGGNHRKYAHNMATGTGVLRFAKVVDQCHSDNIDFENVEGRSWRQLWRGKCAAGAKGSLLPTIGGSIGNQRVSCGQFARTRLIVRHAVCPCPFSQFGATTCSRAKFQRRLPFSFADGSALPRR